MPCWHRSEFVDALERTLTAPGRLPPFGDRQVRVAPCCVDDAAVMADVLEQIVELAD